MYLVGKNWQTTRPTIRERTKFMFNNNLFSVVKFVVRKSDGESESKEVISAHKFVLSIGSPVFEAMFYGELAETRDSIELPDCEYESLLELFRYMYSDEVNLSGSNVMGVLYLAKKYMVPSLADRCTDYLSENLDSLNVFSILPYAQKYKEKNLVDRCWKVIDEETEAAVKSDAFATIERSLLEAVVERETLNVAEVELFKGVVEWAKKELGKRGIVTDGQEKRKIIGEQIIKAIRFPVMKEEEFTTLVLDSKILTYEEVANIIKYFNSVISNSSMVGFPVTRRSGTTVELIRCCRFGSASFGWNNEVDSSIGFSVDRDILLHGVYLFGNGPEISYSVTLTIFSSFAAVSLASTKGTFSSQFHVSARYYGFDVLFTEPILLKKGELYLLNARISGPPSFYGTQGQQTIQCSGVTFSLLTDVRFFSACVVNSARQGQFNEFIFSLIK